MPAAIVAAVGVVLLARSHEGRRPPGEGRQTAAATSGRAG
jgi:hypothetical protein